MSGEPTSPFVPSHALRVWVDRDRLYVAYPAANQGADFVVAYDRNAPGLTCAIAAMAKAYDDKHPAPKVSRPTLVAAPGQRRTTSRQPTLSDDDRAKALEALISAGVLPPTAGN